jgi:hypothetical protein
MEEQQQFELFFSGGNNSDSSPSLQPPNTYRGMYGYTINSLGNDSYSIQSELGNKALTTFKLNPKYTPIDFCLQNRRLIIHSTNDTFGGTSKGEVGIVDLNPVTNQGTYIPLYCHKGLAYQLTKQIEGVSNYENDKIQRNYWSDDVTPPKVLNYALPEFNTYYTPFPGTLPMVQNKSYMVVQGTIDFLGTNYGPNETDTVFQATGVNPTYTIVSGPVRVIEYVPIELLDWIPAYSMGRISYLKWNAGGSVFCGSYQASFQLIGIDGVATPWSYVTKPVQITDGYPSISLVAYQNYQGAQNYVSSGKGIEFLLEDLDLNYTTIRVAIIRNTDYNIPEQPVLFYEGFITGSTMNIQYNGNENLTQLTSADIQELNVYIKRINTISPLKNRMMGANWEGAVSINYDPSSVKIKCIEYLVPTDIKNDNLLTANYAASTWGPNAQMTGTGAAPVAGILAFHRDIYAYSWYEVTGAPILYDGITYNPGDYFQGTINANSFSGNNALVFAVIRIATYGGAYRYIRLQEEFYDNKGTAVDNNLRSNWRREKYRYGIELIGLAGHPNAVNWAGDKTMIAQDNTLGQTDPETGNTWGFDGALSLFNTNGSGGLLQIDQTTLRHIGVEFNDLDIQGIVNALIVSTGIQTLTIADLPKYYSGFRIVRAPRDRQILAQGLMLACYDNTGSTTHICCASDIRVAMNAGSGRRAQLYTIYSPDLNFETTVTPQIINGDKTRLESYQGIRLEVGHISGATPYYLIDKMIHVTTPVGGTPTGYINPFDNIEKNSLLEPDGEFNFQGNQVFYNDADAAGIGTSIGAKTYFFVTSYLENTPGDLLNGYGYWPAGGFQIQAPLVSIIRQKANLYGGTSDSAKANTLYEYCGHSQPFDSVFLAYAASAVDLNGNPKAVGKADGIQVFGGDCWVTYFDLCRTMDDTTTSPTQCYTTIFAVEANTNAMLRDGKHPAKDGPAFNTGATGIFWSSPPTMIEQWDYNPAYSTDEGYYFEAAQPVNFIENNKFIAQAIYSDPKFPGEYIDNYRKFKYANQLNLESALGAAINLITKNGSMFIIQENGISYIPVEERASIPVGPNAPMIIGTGGVMPRYDNTDNYYGNQHQFGLCETPDGFIWFCANRKAFCRLSASKAQPLSVIKGMDAYFQNNVDGMILVNDSPVAGLGIASCYDSRLKRVIMVFKDNTRDGITFTIAYDVKNDQFLGNQKFYPGIMFDTMEHFYSAYEGISQNAFQANHTYAIGDIVGVGFENYVCILGYTTSGFPLQPSVDGTHWAFANSNNQIFLHNSNDVGKFYGIVQDEEVTVSFNPMHGQSKFFNNLEFTGNDIFFDDIEVSNNTQTGADTNIILGPDQDYWFYNNKHFGSIPMTALKERLKDVFLVARFVKKNRLNGSPITSKNKILSLSSIKALFTKAP